VPDFLLLHATFIARDPFAVHGAARLDVVAFDATKTAAGLEALKTP
jgi:hypothetical protein